VYVTFFPSALHAQEANTVEVSRIEVLAHYKTKPTDTKINKAYVDITATQDEVVSRIFGITGGVLLFFGIIIMLHFARPFVQKRLFIKLWRPLQLVLW
jgi:hypothetical protein